MNNKLRVLLLFGGRSAEHEISLLSATNVYMALDQRRYEVFLVGIDQQGIWSLRDQSVFELKTENGRLPVLPPISDRSVVLYRADSGPVLVGVDSFAFGPLPIDVVFPVLHGPYGEDGSVQGLFKTLDLAFVGSGVFASAAAMDKEVAKRLFEQAGVPVARYCCLTVGNPKAYTFEDLRDELGLPLFVKPASLGSSVGVHKVLTAQELTTALNDAWRFDAKVLVEEFIEGRELECAVLGNENPRASGVGEIVPAPTHGFYSYAAKYLDESGATLSIPAEIDPQLEALVRITAVKAYRALGCEGLSRVDFLARSDGDLVVNEINTMPGFTNISMYPKLWEQAGISYAALIDELIALALERRQREAGLLSKY